MQLSKLEKNMQSKEKKYSYTEGDIESWLTKALLQKKLTPTHFSRSQGIPTERNFYYTSD